MTFLRKVLVAAVTGLTLAAPLAAIPAARADSPGATGQIHYYTVYFRANDSAPWQLLGTYTDYYQASADAANARALGYQTYLR